MVQQNLGTFRKQLKSKVYSNGLDQLYLLFQLFTQLKTRLSNGLRIYSSAVYCRKLFLLLSHNLLHI